MNVAGFLFLSLCIYSFAWVCFSLFFACFMELLFYNCIISGMLSMTCSLVAFSSTISRWKSHPSVCLSPLAHRFHQCLTLLWPWSSVSSHTLNAGCLAPIGGYWIAFGLLCLLGSRCSPGSCCLCGGGGVCPSRGSRYYVCVWLASRSGGSSALWSLCDTVVILLFLQEYHSAYCAVLFSSPHGSNLTDTQHTDLIKRRFVRYREARASSFSPLFLFSMALGICYHVLSSLSHLVSLSQSYSHQFKSFRSKESAEERGIKKKKPFFNNVCLSLRYDWWNVMFGRRPLLVC